MSFVYFALIYNWLSDRIDTFGMDLMAGFMTWASAVALVLVTSWILIQGYRMVSGQSRESMMALVMSMTRVAIIVTVATTMSIFGSNLLSFFTTELSTGINQMFTGDNSTTAQTIDDNLAWAQLALAAVDTVQVVPGDTETIDRKNHALLFAGLGTASPPMAAAAMLLLYKFALAIFIGLGPLFILCLIFEQTRSLFQRWLLYGIGTIFSMAVLAFVSSLVLQLSLRVPRPPWRRCSSRERWGSSCTSRPSAAAWPTVPARRDNHRAVTDMGMYRHPRPHARMAAAKHPPMSLPAD